MRNTQIIFEQHCTHPVMRTPESFGIRGWAK